jgi:hypothetical protein
VFVLAKLRFAIPESPPKHIFLESFAGQLPLRLPITLIDELEKEHYPPKIITLVINGLKELELKHRPGHFILFEGTFYKEIDFPPDIKEHWELATGYVDLETGRGFTTLHPKLTDFRLLRDILEENPFFRELFDYPQDEQ